MLVCELFGYFDKSELQYCSSPPQSSPVSTDHLQSDVQTLRENTPLSHNAPPFAIVPDNSTIVSQSHSAILLWVQTLHPLLLSLIYWILQHNPIAKSLLSSTCSWQWYFLTKFPTVTLLHELMKFNWQTNNPIPITCTLPTIVFIASLKHGYLILFLTVKSFLVNTHFIIKKEDLVEVEFSLLLVTLCPVYWFHHLNSWKL